MAGWRAPAFWAAKRRPPWPLRLALGPVAWGVGQVAARRSRQAGVDPGVPVLCVGNVTVGGSGKTTVVIDLVQRLCARGVEVHVLTRGYGGRLHGPHRVGPADTAAMVGDEALLLARHTPVWIGGDRVASARQAVAAGAGALVMDDGLQNPGLHKHLGLLVVDAGAGFGNGRLLPLGPLRETPAAAAARCAAVVRIGDGAEGRLDPPTGRVELSATPVQDPAGIDALRGMRLFAFAGIGRPEKFFDALRSAGLDLAGTRALGDHQPYTPALRARLLDEARRLDAVAVTTPKDLARWGSQSPAPRVVGLRLAWSDETEVEALLDTWLDGVPR